MTLTAPTTPFTFTTVSAAPIWTQTGPTLWAATSGLELRGTIEYTDYRFTACDPAGTVLSTFDTFDLAQHEVLQPSGRRHLKETLSTLMPGTEPTRTGRMLSFVTALAASTAAAVTLMIGHPHP